MRLTLSKRQIRILILLLQIPLIAIIISLLSSCTDTCENTNIYVLYEPIYGSVDSIRNGVETQVARDIEKMGKLYYLNGYLFVNEPGIGVHIIDNRDPANPLNVSFIQIPGNRDIAGMGNILYADSYMDLVVLDISDFNNVKEINRLENFYPNYSSYGYYVDSSKGVVVDWEQTETVELQEVDCEGNRVIFGDWFRWGRGIAVTMEFAAGSLDNSGGGGNVGIGGSMARFTLAKNHMYAVDSYQLYTLDLANPVNPTLTNSQGIGWMIETIFPRGDNLFIGSMSSMIIYDISIPSTPSYVSNFSHIVSCDPVVVEGNYAYVTLRNGEGTICQNFTNQLDVVDISDLSNPTLVTSYPMYNPHGLGIDNGTLFICDGAEGLKIYDASDVNNITSNLLAHYKNIKAFDVIPLNGVLMMIAEDGLYQYDYSDLNNITELSKISFVIN